MESSLNSVCIVALLVDPSPMHSCCRDNYSCKKQQTHQTLQKDVTSSSKPLSRTAKQLIQAAHHDNFFSSFSIFRPSSFRSPLLYHLIFCFFCTIRGGLLERLIKALFNDVCFIFVIVLRPPPSTKILLPQHWFLSTPSRRPQTQTGANDRGKSDFQNKDNRSPPWRRKDSLPSQWPVGIVHSNNGSTINFVSVRVRPFTIREAAQVYVQICQPMDLCNTSAN